MQHMIVTKSPESDAIKRVVDRLILTGWKDVRRETLDGETKLIFERDGDKTYLDDAQAQLKAVQAESKRIADGGEPDPEFFEKLERLRA